MNEQLVYAREEETTTLYIKNTKSGEGESIDGGSNVRAEFLSSMSQEDDRNSDDALSNRMSGEEDRDMDTGLNEEGSFSAEPSMNPFAAFVQDSDPVERTEDEQINEARQGAEQVNTEEAEYLIADVDAQEAELPISDTFTFELSDDDADEEEEHDQEIENVSPSAQSLREEHRRSPIEEMKILLSKYTDTKRGEGEAPQADESIESSSYAQDEQRKRPSLNLANFLPSEEASDPFLQAIQEGDDEETTTINKSEQNSIDDQSESLLPSLSTDARDHFAHEDPFAAEVLEMATPNEAYRETSAAPSAAPSDNAILEPPVYKQKLSSFLYPSHSTDLINLYSKSEDCHITLEDEDEDECASSSFDSQPKNALKIDNGAPDTIFEEEVNTFDSELAETEVQDEDVELANAQTSSLEEFSFLDSIKADIAAGLHLEATISEEEDKQSHAENAVDFLSNIVETHGMNNPSEDDSNPFADDLRGDTLDNQAEVIEVENFGSHVQFSERSIAYKDGKEHIEFPKDTMPEQLLRLDDVEDDEASILVDNLENDEQSSQSSEFELQENGLFLEQNQEESAESFDKTDEQKDTNIFSVEGAVSFDAASIKEAPLGASVEDIDVVTEYIIEAQSKEEEDEFDVKPINAAHSEEEEYQEETAVAPTYKIADDAISESAAQSEEDQEESFVPLTDDLGDDAITEFVWAQSEEEEEEEEKDVYVPDGDDAIIESVGAAQSEEEDVYVPDGNNAIIESVSAAQSEQEEYQEEFIIPPTYNIADDAITDAVSAAQSEEDEEVEDVYVPDGDDAIIESVSAARSEQEEYQEEFIMPPTDNLADDAITDAVSAAQSEEDEEEDLVISTVDDDPFSREVDEEILAEFAESKDGYEDVDHFGYETEDDIINAAQSEEEEDQDDFVIDPTDDLVADAITESLNVAHSEEEDQQDFVISSVDDDPFSGKIDEEILADFAESKDAESMNSDKLNNDEDEDPFGYVTDYESKEEELINDPLSGEFNEEVLKDFAEFKHNDEDPFGCETDDAAGNVADDASIEGQSGEEDAFVNAAIRVGPNSGEVDEEVMEDFAEHANVNESFPVESTNDKELNSKDVPYSIDGEDTSEKNESNVVADPFDDEAISLRMANSEGFQSVELKESGDDADASDKPVEETGNSNKIEKSETNPSQPQEQRAIGKRFGNLRSMFTRRFQRKSHGVPADAVAEDQPVTVPELSELDESAAAEQVPTVIDEQSPVEEEEVKNAGKDLAILQPEIVPRNAAFVDAVATGSFEGASMLAAEEGRDDVFKADAATELDVENQLSETRRPSSLFDNENEHHPSSSFDNEADEPEDILKEPTKIEAELESQASQEHLTEAENIELNSRNGGTQEMDDINEGDLSFAEDDMIEETVEGGQVEKDSVPDHWPVEANVANDIDESDTDSILDVVAIQGVGETIEHNSEIRNHIADSFDELFGADTEGEDEHSVSENNGLSSADHSLDEILNDENAEDEETPTSSFEAEKYAHSDSFGDVMESSEGEDASFGADAEGEDEHSVGENNGLSSVDHSLDESLSYENAEDEEMPTNNFEAEKYTHMDSFGDVMESTREEERENGKFELTRSVSPNLKSSSSISTTSTASYTTPKDKSGHRNSIEFEMMPDNMGQDFNDFTPQPRPCPRSRNAGHRLYAQGIEQERKKALDMKRYNDEWNSSKKLNLETRGRSMSAPRSRNDSNGPSVYSRLYAIAKERDAIVKQELPRMSSTKAIASTPRVRSLSRGGQPAYERLYNLAKSQKTKVEERDKIEAKRASSRGRSFGVLSSQERLYNLAKKKREIEVERLKLRKKEIEEQKKPKGLVLATRNYTPIRARSGIGSNSVHNRLYSLAKVQKSAIEIRQEINAVDESQSPHSTKTRTQRTSGLDRLYGPSLKKQQEGQQRRQMIEMKKKKKVLPSGKISLDKANGIYERGMMIKVNLEVKREDQGLLPYVSPLLNPLLVDGDDDGEYFSQCSPTGRSRSNSVASRAGRSRSNSVASSRPGRSSSRARTPLISRNRASVMPSMPKTNTTPMSEGSRLRARSRLRSSTPTSFSFRSPSPIPARPSTISVVSSSKLTSRLKGRSETPLRAEKRNSTKELLRKMEEDVGFYKKVKAALAEKDKEEADSSDSSAQSRQRANLDSSNHTSPSLPPQVPTTEKLYVSRTPDSPRALKSDISNGTLQTGSIMTNSSNEHESISQGRFLVRPRSADYCD